MVSIADVAALAGVSTTTVSHALSGKRPVSPSVHQRVRAAMDELGYAPSRSAQSLASGRTRIIGLVVPDIGNGYFAELARGVEKAAVDRGYNVLLCTTGFDYERELQALQMIRSRSVDGLVYAAGAPPTNSDLVRLLGDVPLVLVDEEVPDASAAVFVSDNECGGRFAAQHLLALGHRRAIILTASNELVSSTDRVRGFQNAWIAGGGEPPVIRPGGFTDSGGAETVEGLLPEITADGYTAIFAANDLMALGAFEALAAAGLDVPGRVSVVGFDDIAPARFTRPGLTTVRQPVAQLGDAAMRSLISTLEGDSETGARRRVLPVELIVRNSTGPADPTP